ncbi:MAG TPA: rhodanese-like domain-containing protein [Dehalococcoidales bacterium]|nr:rhodanese-like domain-containing protein [Dehalococcoidales bacterium]
MLRLSVSLLTLVLFLITLNGCTGNSVAPSLSTNAGSTPTLSAIYQKITPADARTLITQNQGKSDFVLLDVRTPEEFSAGRIANSINIDFLGAGFKDSISTHSRTKTYLLICRSGNRSGQAATLMKELGFLHIYDLSGGITLWEKEGHPVVK